MQRRFEVSACGRVTNTAKADSKTRFGVSAQRVFVALTNRGQQL
jgi:hypothetical protein